LAAVALALLVGGVVVWLAIAGGHEAPNEAADQSARIVIERMTTTATAPPPELTGEPDKAGEAASPPAENAPPATPPENAVSTPSTPSTPVTASPAVDQAAGSVPNPPAPNELTVAPTESVTHELSPAKKDAPPEAAKPSTPAQPSASEIATQNVATPPKDKPKTPPTTPLAPRQVTLAAVDPALLQVSSRGALPIIGPDGRRPWKVYARPFTEPDNRPRLALIITGLGLSREATQAAIGLPGEVTLSFTAYAPKLEDLVRAARLAGHEVLIDLPMEPSSYPADDPGPHTLITSLNPADNVARLEYLLGRSTGYVGVISQMGSKFTQEPEALRPILRALGERGLLFVDSRASTKSVAARLAAQLEVPRASNDQFLDHEATRPAIDQAIATVENTARAAGVAVAVARPFPVTLERLATWLPLLIEHGIALAPVSAVANRQTDH
jgi:hypothetical protein